MATKTLQAKLTALDASLDELENCLGPLFAQSLPETLLGLETIQQAKLQTLLPYLLYDLVFIYLKTRGIDPRTHPVVTELERVKQYFDKIAKAEKEPETRTTTVDKAAAGRFIKHAIAQAKTVIASPQAALAPSESTSSTFVAPKVTAKMVARAEYQQELREELDAPSDEDDAGLEVIDDQNNDDPAKEQVAVPSLKSQGKQKVNDSTSEPLPGNKRRRNAVDPFTGERLPSTATAPETQSTPAPKSTKKRKTTTSISKLEATSSTVPSTSTPEETEPDSAKKGKKKKAKKAKSAE